MQPGTGRPTALLFCQTPPADSEALRAELRGLGVELFALTPRETLRIAADDEREALPPSPRTFRERAIPQCAQLALLVLDERGEVRFQHSAGASSEAEVLRALRAARSAQLAAVSRREVLAGGLASAGLALAAACAGAPRPKEVKDEASALAAPGGAAVPVTLHVNGKEHRLTLEPRVTLLDALRERLGLTGAKKGCDLGQCGACTVLADGQRVLSCLTLAVRAQRMQITTIEGLAKGDELHPLQQAFLDRDAFQCGYCTPGQILSAVALLSEKKQRSDDELREAMSGNLCRCGAYPNIIAAIRDVEGRS